MDATSVDHLSSSLGGSTVFGAGIPSSTSLNDHRAYKESSPPVMHMLQPVSGDMQFPAVPQHNNVPYSDASMIHQSLAPSSVGESNPMSSGGPLQMMFNTQAELNAFLSQNPDMNSFVQQSSMYGDSIGQAAVKAEAVPSPHDGNHNGFVTNGGGKQNFAANSSDASPSTSSPVYQAAVNPTSSHIGSTPDVSYAAPYITIQPTSSQDTADVTMPASGAKPDGLPKKPLTPYMSFSQDVSRLTFVLRLFPEMITLSQGHKSCEFQQIKFYSILL